MVSSHDAEEVVMSVKPLSRSRSRDLIWFCRRLASALRGGASILCALDAMTEQGTNRARALAQSIRKRIRGGSYIAAALREQGVPSFVWGAVQIGEAKADPAEALSEVADRLELEQGISTPSNRDLCTYSLALGRLGMLVRLGVPILTALEAAAESVPDPRVRAGLLSARDVVRQGRDLSAALEGAAPELPAGTWDMIRDGEQEGRLGEVLAIVGDYLLDEAGQAGVRPRKQEVPDG